MAKKTISSSSVASGKVTVSTGVKFSANFQSQNFDVGVELDIQEGETAEDALERARGVVNGFFRESQTEQLDMLDGVIRSRGRGSKG